MDSYERISEYVDGLVADPDLRTRVTVLDATLMEAPLPDRARIRAMLRQRLAPEGRMVLSPYPPTRPEEVPEAATGEVRAGRRRYSGTVAARPAGPHAALREMRYRVGQDDEPVAAFGLTCRPGDVAAGIQVISR